MKGVFTIITEKKDCRPHCCCYHVTSNSLPPYPLSSLSLSLHISPPSRFVGLILKQLRRSSVKRRWGFASEVGGVNSQQKKPRQSSEEELTQFYQGNPNDSTQSIMYYSSCTIDTVYWDHKFILEILHKIKYWRCTCSV
jgi:hypothetical protein